MAIANLLRNFRIRAGKSQAEVAARLQINPAWYADLERHADQLAATLTLFQAIDLAATLGVRLNELVGAQAAVEAHIPVMELPARIAAYLAVQGITALAFEQQLDYPLRDFMRAPLKEAAELPLEFFQRLGSRLGFDWLALVPEAGE